MRAQRAMLLPIRHVALLASGCLGLLCIGTLLVGCAGQGRMSNHVEPKYTNTFRKNTRKRFLPYGSMPPGCRSSSRSSNSRLRPHHQVLPLLFQGWRTPWLIRTRCFQPKTAGSCSMSDEKAWICSRRRSSQPAPVGRPLYIWPGDQFSSRVDQGRQDGKIRSLRE